MGEGATMETKDKNSNTAVIDRKPIEAPANEQAKPPVIEQAKPAGKPIVLPPRVKHFDGSLQRDGANRKIVSPDYSDPTGKKVTVTFETFSQVNRLRLQAVISFGEKAKNTGEEFVTLVGQYEPFGPLRLTASAQNYETIVEKILKGNVDRSSGRNEETGQIRWPLINELLVTGVGTMTSVQKGGYAMFLRELYLHNADGTVTTIIGPTVAAITASDALADQLL